MTSIVILCNGAFPTEAYPLYLLDSAEGVVCCDGAIQKWLEYNPNANPLAIVGDLDSISAELKERFPSVLVHVSEQDDNDQTKALRWVLENHPEASEIVFLGATGLREDHTIGNLGHLMDFPRDFDLGERKLSMVSDFGTFFVVTETAATSTWVKAAASLFSVPIIL